MTATNDSEASDFLPMFNPAAFLSTTGKVDITEGNRTVTGENLVPGQSASLEVVVPRGGNEEFGYVAYSLDQDKRPDGAVLKVTHGAAPAGQAPRGPCRQSPGSTGPRTRGNSGPSKCSGATRVRTGLPQSWTE